MKNCRFSAFIIFVWSLLSFIRLSAQEKPDTPFILGLKAHYASIIPHSKAIADQSFSNPRGLEAEFSWHLNRDKIWQNFGCFPRVGFSLSYFDFDNPQVLGQGWTLAPYFEPFLFVNNRLNFSFRMGTGLAYLNNVYDAETNPDNLFYSAPISFLLYVNAGLNYRLTENWQLRLSGYFNHISNGGIKEPNKGINYPSISLGAEYIFRPVRFERPEQLDWRSLHQKRNNISVAAFGMATNVADGDNRRYPLGGLMLYYQRIVGRMNAFTGGLEWIADGASKEKSRRAGEEISPHKLSFTVGHELLLGRFRFTQALGVYFFNERTSNAPIYQRYGLEYKINEHLFTGVNMKSHGDLADFLDIRLGYTF